MSPDKNNRAVAQHILKLAVEPKLKVDGYFGPKSIAAAKQWTNWQWKGTPTADRWTAATIQRGANDRGINAGKYDAWFGPQTDDASDRLEQLFFGKPLFGRPDEGLGLIGDTTSKIRCWNPTTAQFRARYGPEGSGQALVESPYPLRLDWDLGTISRRFSAHASLKPRIEAAMNDVLSHYGIERIRTLGLDRFGGCLNVRLKRGGSTPSTHSWGAAIDWYPSANALKMTKKSARFARRDYEPFLDIWERQGFMSLGRCFDFDWMHLQANP